MGTGRGAEAQAELGSRGVRRHAAGVCQGGAAAPGGGAGLARCKAQAYEQELHDRVRFSSRVDKDTTTVTQLSHRGITLTPCNCSALVGTATRLIRDEHYRRVAVVLMGMWRAPFP